MSEMSSSPATAGPPSTPPDAPLLPLVLRFTFPRFSGTPEEARAADLVAEEFTRAGLEVAREPLEASPRAITRIRILAHGLAALLALILGAMVERYSVVATIVGATFLALVVVSGRWPRFLERFFDARPSISSANVIGRVRRSGSRVILPTRVVLLAHLDSKSSRDPTFVPVALLLGAVAIVAILFVRAALAAVHLVTAPPLLMTLPLACFAVAALLRALSNPSGNESPGAMDNASGLAILIDAAHTLPADVESHHPGVELVFLATGAEEIGLAGAMRWIQAHGDECDPGRTVFVNVDSVGVGRGLLALDVRGRAPDGRRMREVVREAARTAGVAMRVLPGLPGVGVDTMPIAARGFATVTILGQVLGAASRRIHTSRDSIEALGEGGMDDAKRVVREIVRAVAAPIRSISPIE